MRPTEGNIMVDVSKCIAVIIQSSFLRHQINKSISIFFLIPQHAIGRKFKNTEEKHDHWLDFACDKFDNQLIKDIKQVLHVLVLYLPIPIFWALYDQQVIVASNNGHLKFVLFARYIIL
jgi:dipeptide/tripeptide permease